MRRTPLVLAVLLAALLLAGCGGAADDASSGGSGEPAPTSSAPAGESDPVGPADGGTTTALTVDPGADTGRCAVPTPEIVQGNDLAFDGVVDTIDENGLVTLRPTAFYAGEATDTVTVQAPSADLQALLAAVDFEQGGRYLVAASGGQVALCTISAAWNPQLADTYEQAFGAPR